MAALQAFPSISEAEFAEACQALESRALDRLDGTDWLSVRWSGEDLFIKQRRRAMDSGQDGRNENPDEARSEENMDNVEDACPETLVPNRHGFDSFSIDFSVTLSPTYCVPVLWFSRQPNADEKAFSLEQVYSQLVPHTLHAPLQSVGVMGGISTAHHPISDRPTFFIHPCNTQEALSVLRSDHALTPEGYLILWLGLVGTSVGLHVPSKIFETE
ncbi:hypothetical protein A1O3_07639, partial [Capronia epimyces CBS 606.96]